MHDNMCGSCKCPHHKVVPLLVTLIGLSLLGKAMGWVGASTADVAWPLFLTLIGLMKLGEGKMCKCDIAPMPKM